MFVWGCVELSLSLSDDEARHAEQSLGTAMVYLSCVRGSGVRGVRDTGQSWGSDDGRRPSETQSKTVVYGHMWITRRWWKNMGSVTDELTVRWIPTYMVARRAHRHVARCG